MLHGSIDFPALHSRTLALRSDLAFRFAAADITSLSLGRNFHALSQQLLLMDVLSPLIQPAASHRQQQAPTQEPSSPSPSPLATDEGGSQQSGRRKCQQLLHLLEGRVGHEAVGVAGTRASHLRSPAATVPLSRLQQVKVDLMTAAGGLCAGVGGDEGEREGGRGGLSDSASESVEESVWRAVEAETAAAVSDEPHAGSAGASSTEGGEQRQRQWLRVPAVGTSVTVQLPVRVDVAGGWSDTPPWSLERSGRVLNLAVELEGKSPVGATVSVVEREGVWMTDDQQASLLLPLPSALPARLSPSLPFCIVQAALVVTGADRLWAHAISQPPSLPAPLTRAAAGADAAELAAGSGKKEASGEAAPACSSLVHVAVKPWGLDVSTWADVPRGSGLGTSSILAAAVVKALLLMMRGGGEGGREGGGGQGASVGGEVSGTGAVSDEEVSRLVLLLEQKMATGGGWQDQVGRRITISK